MRSWLLCALLGLSTGAAFGACAASEKDSGNDDDDTSTGGQNAGGSGTVGSNAGGVGALDGGGTGGLDPDAACAKFTEEAKQAPAAMLIVVDRSASMGTGQKWGAAQLAIVGAIDKDVFDTMSLGLVSFPQTFVDPPQCLCDYACGCDIQTCKLLLGGGVACGISALPQVALKEAGVEKSNDSTGVRHDIYNYLVGTSPISDPSDASPIYDALVAGYNALKLYPIDKRILVLITDGGFSCTSLAVPSRPGYSDGACNDWEYPDSVNQLITQARTDPNAPINTFVVGVPGSDSTGQMQGSYATAPYAMKLALSTYAVSGSPDTLDPACDSAAVFSQAGAAPAAPCHIDLSNNAMFDATALAAAIETIRGKALGCVYDVPDPPPGETIDPAQVNVLATINGGQPYNVPKRSNQADTCTDGVGCWDYTDGTQQQVELIGKACEDLSSATEAKVEVLVGCETILK